MKLLIVDDEELTREGLISSINWDRFGITEIYQADDGIHGLSLAKKHCPEIILCDVRMPRMTGIEMMEKIQAIAPETAAIFMSGYSDKEYLKAAIKLQAINYVEKPLNISEIEDALSEAIDRYRTACRSKQNETKRKLVDASSLALSLTFCDSSSDPKRLIQLAQDLGFSMSQDTCFTTWILKFPHSDQLPLSFLSELPWTIMEYLKKYRIQALHVDKHVQYMIFHLFGNTPPSSLMFSDFGKFLQEVCRPAEDFFISYGSTVTGIHHVYSSYTEAVLLLQSSFFFASQSILSPSLLKKSRVEQEFILPGFMKDFTDSLENKDPDACFRLLENLFQYYNENMNLLPNEAKDTYYRLLMQVQETGHQLQISLPEFSQREGNLITYLEECATLRELSDALKKQIQEFFSSTNAKAEENSIVFLIKEYISKQYARESLSVKDISEHVFLSASYVCTLFKTETGQTLNQYITEYRINKAKQLLRDPRYKITEISYRVGYSDSNYFGKSFKKSVGMSPSEYRETMLS